MILSRRSSSCSLVRPVREAFSSSSNSRGVFHERAHVGVFIPLLLLHRGAGGGVLGALDGGAVGGVVLDDVVVNFGGEHRLLAGDVELGELVEQLGVFRAALADGFQGEGGGFEEFELDAGVEEQVVGLVVEGILFEFLLDEREGASRVFFGRALEFHDAHAAGLHAEEAAFFLGAAGELEFAFAKHFAAFEEPGAVFEDGLQQADAVGKVGGLNGGESFEPKGLEVRREFFFGDLGHGDESSAVFENATSSDGVRAEK